MPSLSLKVLLPFAVLIDLGGVMRVVAETTEGSFGFLPNRLDCVAALVPGILTYQTECDGEALVAVDEGTLVKSGCKIAVSVRRAMVGNDLAKLRDDVAKQYVALDADEQKRRKEMKKLEAGFLEHMAGFARDR
jgi:F-type H+-transporting ATPase subunit epsilon